ncbi:FCD domain-containing protein [Nocardia beijingensis]|uniref:FCD domain-containing protein n=1 Tax=Nocardia implantans TaxID=3108168 RepID=UPI0018947909|nr:FCD domain-containing protein [Nocardia beijingensis]
MVGKSGISEESPDELTGIDRGGNLTDQSDRPGVTAAGRVPAECASGHRRVDRRGDCEPGRSRTGGELHGVLAEVAARHEIVALIGRLGTQVVRYQLRLSLRSGRPQISLEENPAIIDAVTAHQQAGAEQAMRGHLGSVITGHIDR